MILISAYTSYETNLQQYYMIFVCVHYTLHLHVTLLANSAFLWSTSSS